MFRRENKNFVEKTVDSSNYVTEAAATTGLVGSIIELKGLKRALYTRFPDQYPVMHSLRRRVQGNEIHLSSIQANDLLLELESQKSTKAREALKEMLNGIAASSTTESQNSGRHNTTFPSLWDF